MTPGEQQMFDAFVAHRRSLYSRTQFWLVMTPVLIAAGAYLFVVFAAVTR